MLYMDTMAMYHISALTVHETCRVPNPPAPTSFPTGAVAAQGGITPADIQQVRLCAQGCCHNIDMNNNIHVDNRVLDHPRLCGVSVSDHHRGILDCHACVLPFKCLRKLLECIGAMQYRNLMLTLCRTILLQGSHVMEL